MKICFISLKAYPIFNPKVKSTFGGAEVQLYCLAKELAKNQSLDINFIVADYGQDNKEKIEDICVWKSLNFEENFLKQALVFLRIFNKINAVIYIQRTLTVQSGLIALYCKFKKKKFIYMVAHDNETDGSHRIYKNFLKSIFADLTFRYASEVIVQNDYQKKNFYKRHRKNPLILNSSYEIQEYKGEKNSILWVGRSEVWKRPELFLKLAELNPKENFVMICPPSTSNAVFSTEIEERAKNLKNLNFYSFVPFRYVNNFFQKAKIYVTTSEQEGFQNTLIQATKNKTPILSLNVNPNEFITKYKCGFFCNNDFNLLNESFKKLLKEKDIYNEMSENAYKYARENHDIKVNVKKFLGIIKK